MDKKNITTIIVVAVVVGALGFFGGYKYEQGKKTSASAARTGAAGFAGRRGGAAGAAAGGGFTAGQIISEDSTGITIKTANGGSKIVLVPSSAQIAKSAAGTMADLTTGQNVVVTGTTNSDGSITAEMVQIRPAMATPATP